jgi:hypothetical protein
MLSVKLNFTLVHQNCVGLVLLVHLGESVA